MNKSDVSMASALRFGVFEMDLQAGDLRKSGLNIHLPPQPFKILALLACHPGQIVTREDIRQRVWGAKTFVDFELGVNHCIRQIRAALGDDAETPRYIETLPRRGYRFIYPVETARLVVSEAESLKESVSTPPRAEATSFVSAQVRTQGVSLLGWWALAATAGSLGVMAVLFAFNLAGLRYRALRAVGSVRETPVQIRSIAVLPLENLSGDPEQEYLAEGMTDELITRLGEIGALRVVSRQSVVRYKGSSKPLTQIARELNVRAIVEGTIQRSGNRIHITVNLLDARADRHLWAETYDRELSDVLTLEGNVSSAIVQEIRVNLTPREQVRLAKVRPVNPEAHDEYLRGRYYLNKRTSLGLRRGVGYFRKALQEEPNYALAYAGLADAYLLDDFYGVLPPEDSFSESRSAAQKALEIDDDLGEARVVLADIMFYHDWDWAGADAAFRRALESDPSYAPAHQWYGEYLASMGRHQEAIEEFNRAEEIDPFSPILPTMEGQAFHLGRDDDRAIVELRRAIDMDPNFPRAHWFLGQVYERKGMWRTALTELEEAKNLEPNDPDYVAALGQAYAAAGKAREAIAVLQELKLASKERYVSAFDMAIVYIGLHRKDEAIAWLQKAYGQHSHFMTRLKVDPGLDDLRSDPRFQALLHRMNFPP